MSLFDTLKDHVKSQAMKTIEHVATARDGGSMLLKYGEENYILDHAIGSKTRGQIFKGISNRNREDISADLDAEIRNAYWLRYAKDLPRPEPESGVYDFKDQLPEPEPAPSVSLYNLLDHTAEDLQVMVHAAETMIRNMEPVKESFPKFYPSCIAWKRIFEQARIEVIMKDKTAKEITNQTK